MTIPRSISSIYIEWSKLCPAAKYNLATSGIQNYPLAELQVSIDQLEINGPSIYGYEPLQERLARKSGVPANCVVATHGTGMANHLAMAAILEPGDDVLVEQPTYAPILEVASWFRANILRFPRRAENNYQIDPDELRRCITPKTRLICLANLHNPSGALIGEALLNRVGELAASVGAKVLVDEVYLDLVYDPPQRSSFYLGDNFVVTSSLTKAYGLSGLRCGWILAPAELAKRIWRLKTSSARPLSIPVSCSV